MDYSLISYQRTAVQSEEIISSVNEVVSKHYLNVSGQLELNLPMDDLIISNDKSRKMQLDSVFRCEVDTRLWDKALCTASADITTTTYPHKSVIESLVNYTLNVYGSTDAGLVADIFSKLLTFHPPVTVEMREYYHELLNRNYVKLNDKKVEEENVFWCLINNLEIYAENINCLDDIDEVQLTSLKETESEDKKVSKYLRKAKEKRLVMYFDELSEMEKIKRCLICLKFLIDIFEADFVHWCRNKKLKLVPFDRLNQPLLAGLIWKDTRDIGIFNSNVKKILGVQQKLQECNSTEIFVVDKLLALIAEMMHHSDALEDPIYPFLGFNSDSLARELSFFILESLKEKRTKNDFNVCELTMDIQPTWLRLLVISHLLSVITGSSCAPELTCAVDILDHIDHVTSNKESVEKSTNKRKSITADPDLVEKFKKLKSVNIRSTNGGTRLHKACDRNKIDEVKALLTFPELELNATDNDNYTALHKACYKGNKEVVEELLSFCPQLGEVQKPVDTKSQGKDGLTPLMCAVLGNHPDICKLLLEHTGSVLLEDVNEDNKTPLDLSQSSAVTKILKHYQINIKTTEHSKKKFHFSSDNTDVVLELCYQLIQAYFSTHRTWDVYHALKTKLNQPSEISSYRIKKGGIQYSYARYHRDIKTNIDKLRKVVTKLKNLDFKSSIEPLLCILSLNKYS